MKTVVVVPCFNEESRLPTDAFLDYAAQRKDVLFLLVNDGSEDGTLSVLESIREQSPDSFQVLDLPENRGKADAVRTGMLAALDLEPSYFGFWDADLATPLDAIPLFERVLDERSGVDLVTGARVKLLGRTIERSLKRHYAGRVFATVVSNLLRLEVYDTQCGAKLFRVVRGARELFAQPFIARWIFDVEILARMIRERGGSRGVESAIVELPLPIWCDVSGSKLKLADFLRAPVDLFRIWKTYLRRL
jgi:glycosyltransferase involved in cell wall biosynthesis